MGTIGARTAPPEFVKLREGVDPHGDTGKPEMWDAWAVTPTGVEKDDYLKGAEYADEALRRVYQTESPGALTFTLTTIFTKIVNGEIKPGSMEKGFLDCLARRGADRRQQLDSN